MTWKSLDFVLTVIGIAWEILKRVVLRAANLLKDLCWLLDAKMSYPGAKIYTRNNRRD